MKRNIQAGIAVTALFFASSGYATVLGFDGDFAGEADANGERALGLVATDNVFEIVGGFLVVTATGGNPYLDATSGGPGGLGVCTTIVATQCVPGDDDNVSAGETVTLTFYSDAALTIFMTVDIHHILFRNASHGTTFSGEVEIKIDGGASTWHTLVNEFNTGLIGHTFFFGFGDGFDSNNVEHFGDLFYIQTILIPEPTTLVLFGLGLIALGISRRKSLIR